MTQQFWYSNDHIDDTIDHFIELCKGVLAHPSDTKDIIYLPADVKTAITKNITDFLVPHCQGAAISLSSRTLLEQYSSDFTSLLDYAILQSFSKFLYTGKVKSLLGALFDERSFINLMSFNLYQCCRAFLDRLNPPYYQDALSYLKLNDFFKSETSKQIFTFQEENDNQIEKKIILRECFYSFDTFHNFFFNENNELLQKAKLFAYNQQKELMIFESDNKKYACLFKDKGSGSTDGFILSIVNYHGDVSVGEEITDRQSVLRFFFKKLYIMSVKYYAEKRHDDLVLRNAYSLQKPLYKPTTLKSTIKIPSQLRATPGRNELIDFAYLYQDKDKSDQPKQNCHKTCTTAITSYPIVNSFHQLPYLSNFTSQPRFPPLLNPASQSSNYSSNQRSSQSSNQRSNQSSNQRSNCSSNQRSNYSSNQRSNQSSNQRSNYSSNQRSNYSSKSSIQAASISSLTHPSKVQTNLLSFQNSLLPTLRVYMECYLWHDCP